MKAKIDKSKLRKILTDVSNNAVDIDIAVSLIEKLEKDAEEWENKIETTKNEINLSRGCIDSRDFFSDIEDRLALDKLREGDPEWEKNVNLIRFHKRQNLLLDVVVEDEVASEYLIKWLYSLNDNNESLIPFGCKLNQINFNENTQNKDDIKRQLIELIESL